MTIGLTGLQVFSRVSFFPGIAWNTVTWRWRNYQWYNRIDNTIVLGALPFRSQAEEVRREHVDKMIMSYVWLDLPECKTATLT